MKGRTGTDVSDLHGLEASLRGIPLLQGLDFEVSETTFPDAVKRFNVDREMQFGPGAGIYLGRLAVEETIDTAPVFAVRVNHIPYGALQNAGLQFYDGKPIVYFTKEGPEYLQ